MPNTELEDTLKTFEVGIVTLNRLAVPFNSVLALAKVAVLALAVKIPSTIKNLVMVKSPAVLTFALLIIYNE